MKRFWRSLSSLWPSLPDPRERRTRRRRSPPRRPRVQRKVTPSKRGIAFCCPLICDMLSGMDHCSVYPPQEEDALLYGHPSTKRQPMLLQAWKRCRWFGTVVGRSLVDCDVWDRTYHACMTIKEGKNEWNFWPIKLVLVILHLLASIKIRAEARVCPIVILYLAVIWS